eukprot:COSAG01_NODE_17744_length_1127_cov_1.277237_2_plen_128_part_00
MILVCLKEWIRNPNNEKSVSTGKKQCQFKMNFVSPPHRLAPWVLYGQELPVARTLSTALPIVHYTCGELKEAELFRLNFVRVAGDNYDMRYYDDNAMLALVSEFGTDVLRAYHRVRPFAFKADIFRH